MAHQPAPTLPDSAAGLAWLGLSLGMSLLALAMRGYRWHRIMALAHVDHQRSDALALTAVAYMGNNVLPARGGEVLKIAILGARSTSRRREILGSVVAERLLDAVVLAGMFVVLSLGLADSPAGTGTSLLIGGAILAGFAALAIYLWLRRSGRFERFAATIRPVARACRLFAHPSGVPLGRALGGDLGARGPQPRRDRASSIGISLKPLDGHARRRARLAGRRRSRRAGLRRHVRRRHGARAEGRGITGGAASGILILSRFMYFVPATVVGLVVLVTRYGGFAGASAGRRRRRRGTASPAPARRAASGGIAALARGSAGAGR